MLNRPNRWMSSVPGILLCVTAPLALGQVAGDVPAGIVVEAVTRDSAAEKAGMQPGDVILSWMRAGSPPANPQPAQGTIGSPFALADVESEQAPRGPVTLQGRRGGESMAWTLAPHALA